MEITEIEAIKKRLDEQDSQIAKQNEIIKEQKGQLEDINDDQATVQAGQMLAREQLRKNQKEIELRKHKSPTVKRNLNFLFDLQFMVTDALEAWEGIAPALSEIQMVDRLPKHMIKVEQIDDANRALEATIFGLSEMSVRVKKEIFMNEAASSAPMGFGIAPILEGKANKFSGDTQEDQESNAAKFKAGLAEFYKENPKKRGQNLKTDFSGYAQQIYQKIKYI